MFDVGSPGAGIRFSPLGLGGPVALPSPAVLFRPPGSPDDNLPGGRERPGALGRVGVLGQRPGCPRAVKGLPAAGGGDPCSVEGLGRLLR